MTNDSAMGSGDAAALAEGQHHWRLLNLNGTQSLSTTDGGGAIGGSREFGCAHCGRVWFS